MLSPENSVDFQVQVNTSFSRCKRQNLKFVQAQMIDILLTQNQRDMNEFVHHLILLHLESKVEILVLMFHQNQKVLISQR